MSGASSTSTVKLSLRRRLVVASSQLTVIFTWSTVTSSFLPFSKPATTFNLSANALVAATTSNSVQLPATVIVVVTIGTIAPPGERGGGGDGGGGLGSGDAGGGGGEGGGDDGGLGGGGAGSWHA